MFQGRIAGLKIGENEAFSERNLGREIERISGVIQLNLDTLRL